MEKCLGVFYWRRPVRLVFRHGSMLTSTHARLCMDGSSTTFHLIHMKPLHEYISIIDSPAASSPRVCLYFQTDVSGCPMFRSRCRYMHMPIKFSNNVNGKILAFMSSRSASYQAQFCRGQSYTYPVMMTSLTFTWCDLSFYVVNKRSKQRWNALLWRANHFDHHQRVKKD